METEKSWEQGDLQPLHGESSDKAKKARIDGSDPLESASHYSMPGVPVESVSQPLSVEEYYSIYLRHEHPDSTAEDIERTVNTVLSIPEVRDSISDMLRLELEIRRENPDWEGGWLRQDSDSS